MHKMLPYFRYEWHTAAKKACKDNTVDDSPW